MPQIGIRYAIHHPEKYMKKDGSISEFGEIHTEIYIRNQVSKSFKYECTLMHYRNQDFTDKIHSSVKNCFISADS